MANRGRPAIGTLKRQYMSQKVYTANADFDITGYTAYLVKANNISLWRQSIGQGVQLNNYSVGYTLSLDSASNINFSGTNKITLLCWANPIGFGAVAGASFCRLGTDKENTNGYFTITFAEGIGGNAGYFLITVKINSPAPNFSYKTYRISTSIANAWHHFVFVMDKSVSGSGQIEMYLDDVLQTAYDSHYYTTTGNFASDIIYFGGHEVGNARNFYIDEISFYSAAFTQADVDKFYAAGRGRYGAPADSNLMAGWHLDEGAGMTSAAYSGSTPNLNLYPTYATWVTGTVNPFYTNSPVAKLITAGQIYALKAADGYYLNPSAFDATEIVGAGSSIVYRYCKSNSGSYPTGGWSSWLSKADFNTACAAGSVSGMSYVFIEAKFISDGSDEAELDDATLTYTTAEYAPDAPSNLVAVAATPYQINLAWQDNSNNEDEFVIERAPSASGPFVGIATVSADVTAYQDYGLTSKTYYCYRIKADNSGGDSAYSNIAMVATMKDYNDWLKDISRTPISLVVLEMDYCSLSYGITPCTATAPIPCYNTFPTCKDKINYALSTKMYRFTSFDAPLPFKAGERPYVAEISYSPTEIKTNLTVNSRTTITMQDEPDTDRGVDPYVAGRTSVQGTFWKKFLARNPNYKGRIVRIYDGFLGLPEKYWKPRWYGGIDNITINKGQVKIEAVDILKSLAKINVPPKLNIELLAAVSSKITGTHMGLVGQFQQSEPVTQNGVTMGTIDSIDTTNVTFIVGSNGLLVTGQLITGAVSGATLTLSTITAQPDDTIYLNSITDTIQGAGIFGGETFEVESLDSPAGYIRIGDEIIHYTGVSGNNLTGCNSGRGCFGTTPGDAGINAKVQKVRYYEPDNPFEILKTMLMDDGGLDANLISDIANVNGIFSADPDTGENVIGRTSGAIGKLIAISATELTIQMPLTATTNFIENEYIDGQSSNAYCLLSRFDRLPVVDLVSINKAKAMPGREPDYSSVIADSGTLESLYFEVLDLLDCKSWVNEDLQIKVKRNLPNRPDDITTIQVNVTDISGAVVTDEAGNVVTSGTITDNLAHLTDQANIVNASGSVNLNDAANNGSPFRLTRVSVYWDKTAIGNQTDIAGYNKFDVAIDANAESNYEYNEVDEKILYCRWLRISFAPYEVTRTLQIYVRNLAMRRVARYREALPLITFDVELKDAKINTGDDIRISTDELTDKDGNSLDQSRCQVVKRVYNAAKGTLTLTAMKYSSRKIAYLAPANTPNFANASITDKEYGFYSDAEGKLNNKESEGYHIY
jgi:hypothetical protein